MQRRDTKGIAPHAMNQREQDLMRLLGKHDNGSAASQRACRTKTLSEQEEYVGKPYENSRIFKTVFVSPYDSWYEVPARNLSSS